MGRTGPRAIDWGTAQRVGELIAGSPPYGGVRSRCAQSLAHDFARRVSDHTGLQLPAELPPLEMVDRPSWIAANLLTMRPLLDPFVDRLVVSGDGLLSGPLQAVSGRLLGAQLGAVTGMLSQRVLGQYDLSLLDDSVTPRLLLLAPNLAAAARTLGVDREELIAWVAIHEITHAVQFSGAPWLREHLGGMLRELLAGLRIAPATAGGSAEGENSAAAGGMEGNSAGERGVEGDSAGESGGSSWTTDLRALLDRARDGGELRTLIDRARHGELLRITLGDERWQLVERMQATMSLIEGHAEYTMDAVGADVLPSLPRLRAAMTRRRESRGLPWRVLERVLGLELKMRQYEVGRRFCDAVVQAGGPELLAVAWRSPEELPTSVELTEPERWIERVQVPA